jgi:uncharacterized membrane protein
MSPTPLESAEYLDVVVSDLFFLLNLSMSSKTRYWIVIVLCVIALINAVYLTYHAYSLSMSTGPSRCDVNDRWSCTNVLAAPESKIFGVPFPAIAMVVYPILLAIAGAGLTGRMRHAWKRLAALSAGGMMFNGYIIFVEATQI